MIEIIYAIIAVLALGGLVAVALLLWHVVRPEIKRRREARRRAAAWRRLVDAIDGLATAFAVSLTPAIEEATRSISAMNDMLDSIRAEEQQTPSEAIDRPPKS